MINKFSQTSIVLPFYKKHSELEFSLYFNHIFFEKVKEVILVFDEPEDLDKNHYLSKYPNINFVFYINSECHPWRNPCVPINHGIKNSTGEYIIVLSPETILLENSLENLLLHTTEQTFACGKIIFTTYPNVVLQQIYHPNVQNNIFNSSFNISHYKGPVSYGSICCTKANLFKANLYSEEFFDQGWGGEDDDIRKKLEDINIQKIIVNDANFIHLEDKPSIHRFYKEFVTSKKDNKDQKNHKKYNNYNHQSLNNSTNVNSKINYVDHPLIIQQEFQEIKKSYPIILLVQSYNESNNVLSFIKSVSNFVDGIIVLDDGSTDNTYELWDLKKHKNIIAKFKKTRNNTFNDIENRNLLLYLYEQITEYCDNQWIMWLDLDERLGDDLITQLIIRKNLLSNNNIDFDILKIDLCHMWNNTHYNAEYPSSRRGIQKRHRLCQQKSMAKPYHIESKQKLHFRLCPVTKKSPFYGNLPLMVQHMGTSSVELREQKFNKYTQEYDLERCQLDYGHLIKEKPMLQKFVPNSSFLSYYQYSTSLLYSRRDMINPSILPIDVIVNVQKLLFSCHLNIKQTNAALYEIKEYNKVYPDNAFLDFAQHMLKNIDAYTNINTSTLTAFIHELSSASNYIA